MRPGELRQRIYKVLGAGIRPGTRDTDLVAEFPRYRLTGFHEAVGVK